MPDAPRSFLIHATTVSDRGRALIIRGASGSGKSSLALRLLALGADLVSDDQTLVSPQPDGPPLVSAPPAISGLIEAWGLGLLAVDPVRARAAAILDLDLAATARMPTDQTETLAGYDLPLLHNAESPHFTSALLLYLRGGKADR